MLTLSLHPNSLPLLSPSQSPSATYQDSDLINLTCTGNSWVASQQKLQPGNHESPASFRTCINTISSSFLPQWIGLAVQAHICNASCPIWQLGKSSSDLFPSYYLRPMDKMERTIPTQCIMLRTRLLLPPFSASLLPFTALQKWAICQPHCHCQSHLRHSPPQSFFDMNPAQPIPLSYTLLRNYSPPFSLQYGTVLVLSLSAV